ncbi:MAG: threonylcarbamoyl-AMP synthase [Gammaproteobacteria bacterium]|nr:MAG: threonylcarbamoyl-AMP synthase [Gammaproteobacteria bacterium]
MQVFHVHPDNPQPRLIKQAVEIVRQGGVIAYPTDSSYALGCHIGDKAAMERMRRIRKLDDRHNFTLVCRDLSEIAAYAKVDNPAYRLMKSLTPGPYTFILQATHEVPRRLQNPKRKTIGLRVPDHVVAQSLLQVLGEPLMSCTLILPDCDTPLSDPGLIQDALKGQVDLLLDGGHCGLEPTTVVDLTHETPRVTRAGKGAARVAPLLA